MRLIVGLPVRLLVELAVAVKNELKTPLDVVLSYSHMTLQNTTLGKVVPEFHAAGVKQVLTGSPLSMGLLRAAGPHPWHPATASLRAAVVRASEYVEMQGDNLVDTAMRFVFARWNGCVIGGWSSVKELEDAVRMWHRVKGGVRRAEDERLWQAAREVMGREIDTMWTSPPKGWVYKDGTKVE